jgi:hypothetical protein
MCHALLTLSFLYDGHNTKNSHRQDPDLRSRKDPSLRGHFYGTDLTMRLFGALALITLAVPAPAQAQAQAKAVTAQEQTACRTDALRFCLFKLGDADALRQCLRDNRANLSTPCLALLKSRGN